MSRVSVYIDGFNLYFWIVERGWRKYLWLDLAALSRAIITNAQSLATTKYFTARIRASNQKRTRQSSYLQAIDATGGVDIFFGRYQKKGKECRQCHSTWTEYEEKMSDVRIATELLRDAFKNSFDTAILVSADADLLPPIEAIKEDFPSKSIVIWFPPKRDNPRLQRAAHATSRIGKGLLSKCQLPNSVTKPDGYIISRPTEWS